MSPRAALHGPIFLAYIQIVLVTLAGAGFVLSENSFSSALVRSAS